MARIVLLDTSTLGLACARPGPQVDQCRVWLVALEAALVDIVIPAIADYETRRELVRRNAHAQLLNLESLLMRFPYLEITREALGQAAEFWALVRNQGLPTAAPEALDADAILAGCAATLGQPGDQVTIATHNVRHLGRFPGIDAQPWTTIT
jgi:predicted nucleic acid-binding protein